MIMSDTKRTDAELERVNAGVPAALVARLEAYVTRRFSDLFEHGNADNTPSGPSIFTLEDVQRALGPADWPASDQRLQLRYLRVLTLLSRRQEKRAATELIGSDHVNTLIQKILPIIQQPLMEIYAAGDLGTVRSQCLGHAMPATRRRPLTDGRTHQEVCDRHTTPSAASCKFLSVPPPSLPPHQLMEKTLELLRSVVEIGDDTHATHERKLARYRSAVAELEQARG